MTTVVSIGRNIGTLPMADSRWAEFTGAVCELVEKHEGLIYTKAWGTGEWEGDEEESFQVTFGDGDVDAIRSDLSLLAYIYEQDAIAVVTGPTVLVTA